MPPRFRNGKPLFKDGKPSFCDPCCPSVCPPLTADFDWTNDGLYYYFTDQSETEEPAEIISWHWDFGDGDTSDEQNPSHLYADDETYTVCLTVCTSEAEGETPACCDTICKTPCNDAPIAFGGCSEEGENSIVECLRNMQCLIQFEFENVEGDLGCSLAGMSGIYPWKVKDGTFLDKFYDKLSGLGCGGYLVPCSATGYGVDLNIGCFEGQLTLGTIWGGMCLPGEGGWLSYSAGDSFDLPITVYSGIEFDLGAISSSTGMSGTIKLRFVGKPCEEYDPDEEANCDDPPIVDFTFESPFGESNCYKELDITITSTCPIDYCWWSDGNAEGCDRPDIILGPDACGDRFEYLTLFAVDKRGCIGSVTKHLTCCSCETSSGICGGGTPSLVLYQDGPVIDTIDHGPIGGECGGSKLENIANFILQVSYPDEHDCGSYAVWVEFHGIYADGTIWQGWAPGAPDGFGGRLALIYFDEVHFIWAPTVCIKAYLVAITDGGFDPETDDIFTIEGCQGPVVCNTDVLSDSFYPGNAEWVDLGTCTHGDPVNCCDSPEPEPIDGGL